MRSIQFQPQGTLQSALTLAVAMAGGAFTLGLAAWFIKGGALGLGLIFLVVAACCIVMVAALGWGMPTSWREDEGEPASPDNRPK